MIKEYVRNIRSRGYKVLEVPYIPFSVDLIGVIKRGMAQGDALKVYKEERCNYDAVVSNAFTRPRIELYHPDFLKDFYSVDKHYEYPKYSILKLNTEGNASYQIICKNCWQRTGFQLRRSLAQEEENSKQDIQLRLHQVPVELHRRDLRQRHKRDIAGERRTEAKWVDRVQYHRPGSQNILQCDAQDIFGKLK